jgi:uncharacterized iron-regulated membrane protein
MTFRQILFWPHLIAGVLAGLVILLMSVTGVLLTYERQMIAWADSGFRSSPPTAEAAPLSIDALLAAVQRAHPDVVPTTVTVRADTAAAVAVAAGQRTLYVDRYSGTVVGEPSRGGVRALMAELRAWHRWFAVDGDGRPLARAITGWSNFLFLFLVVSGAYLWLPRRWTWPQVRNVLLFNPRARGKARDFNWHNVIGSWCAIPLFVVVLSALPISFGWFNALVYRAVGEAPPPAGGGRAAPPAVAPGEGARSAADGRPGAERPAPRSPAAPTLDALWRQGERQVAGWRSIALRIPASADAATVLTIDRGDGGQPHLRSTLTLDSRTAAVVSHETFADLTLGRRIRNTMRFAHTGEVIGIPGQTVAGIASTGGAVLVWTGLALAWRRLRAWFTRRGRADAESRISSAA